MMLDQKAIDKAATLPAARHVIRFGPYVIDTRVGLARKHGLPIKLSGQPMQVLMLLLARPGELVSRAELREQLWPDGVYVDFERSLNSAIKKLRRALNDDPQEPRYIETQPRQGYRFIGAVDSSLLLEAQPAGCNDSDDGAATFLSEVRSGSVADCNFLRHASAYFAAIRDTRFLAYAGLALVVAIAGLLGFTQKASSKSVPRPVQQTHFRSSVALLGLKNLSPKTDGNGFSSAITQMLATELAQRETVRVISAENVVRAKLDLGITNEEYSREMLRALRSYLGSDYLVTGSYISEDHGPSGHIRLDLRLQEAISGETLASIGITGKQSELIDLVSQAGHVLRSKLRATAAPEGDVDWRTVFPENEQAAQLYTQGLTHLRQADGQVALDVLQKCVAMQPTFALAHAALAETWSLLGYRDRAVTSAQLALSLADSLPEDERLAIEGRYYEVTQDWAGAAGVYRHLWHDYPDDMDSGLRLVAAETSAGKINEASATISALRATPGPAADDPRIDLAEGQIAQQDRNYDRAEVLAKKATMAAHQLGAQALEAQARTLMEDALRHQL